MFVPSDATGGFTYEIFGMGWKIEGGMLELRVDTGFPVTGDSGGTSYGTTHINPGDLYLNIDGFRTGGGGAGGGTVYGVATANRGAGWATNDPNEAGLPWPAVVQAHLYKNAAFSTGTFETYENQVVEVPVDGGNDPFGHGNNYPALIAGYGSDLGLLPAFSYTKILANGTVLDDWTYNKNHWRIAASVPLSALSLTPFVDHTFEAWWSMECGNDAVKVHGTIPAVIPEPSTLALVGLGLGALLRRRRRR